MTKRSPGTKKKVSRPSGPSNDALERLVEEALKSRTPGLAESFGEYQKMRRAYDADMRKGRRIHAPAGQYQTTQ